MSDDKKKDAVTDEEKKAQGTEAAAGEGAGGKEELTEDQLEAVAGGVLIGLNQPAVAWKDPAAQKGFEYGGLADVKLNQGFKFIK